MLLYILGIAVAVIVILLYFSPKRFNVKASRPSGTNRRPDRWIMSGFAVDRRGNPIDTTKKFVGRVDGLSMSAVGIPTGATVIGSYLNDDERKRVSAGDIVVVRDAHVEGAEDEYCLRRIKNVKNGIVEYFEDNGGAHDPHDEEKMVAIVTSFVPPKVLRGFFDLRAA